LGSSPFQPGNTFDFESISLARSALAGVNFETLAPRSKCIFQFTQSDIYKIEGNVENAIKFAETALEIAKNNGFQTEVISVQNRLKNLNRPAQAQDHEVEALTDRQSNSRSTVSYALGMSHTSLMLPFCDQHNQS